MLRLFITASLLKHTAVQRLKQLRGDKSGVTAIEYGLIAGAIAVAIIAAVIAVGGDVKGMFDKTHTSLSTM
ncbi:MAG: Flp family type IVb pilin [Proteobacteria bacterium]|nr:Flp family type IVb pilin [Pseudomonadota bacterium]